MIVTIQGVIRPAPRDLKPIAQCSWAVATSRAADGIVPR